MIDNVSTLPAQMFDPDAFSAGFDEKNPIPYCRDAIAASTQYQHEQFHSGAQARDLIVQRSLFVDTLLGLLWDRCDWADNDLALVAVGGYGRGELHPHSDVDLLVLTSEEISEKCRESLSSFLTLLGDIRLDPGYAVRTIKECVEIAHSDIKVVTNLMEAHVIRGSVDMMIEVQRLTGPQSMWPSREFFHAKIDEQRQRHTRFADTEYNLEPNIKSSPGCLRDLQVIGWIAERHFGVDSIEQITAEEFLSPDERQTLIDGRAFMWQVRYALHMITGREEDQLRFDHQRELAALWP
jgi:[protein-PII] uridylyltransferase